MSSNAESTIYRGTDPITVEVVRSSLESTVEQMGVTVMRLAHSPLFTESKDFSVAVFDQDAQLAALAQYTPGHQGGMQTALEAVLKLHPSSTLRPGDVIMMNDPYLGGLHQQDLTLLGPIFYKGRLVMYAGCVAHRVDIGGMTPGSYCSAATEIYQEGLRFPGIKLIDQGKMNQDILRLFLTNIRLPEDQEGDLMAQIAAIRGAEKGVTSLIDRYGVEGFLNAVRASLDIAEQRTRRELEKIPDGSYEYEDHIDHDGITDRTWKLKVTVTIKGSNAKVDFAGSDEQAEGSINSAMSLTRSNSYVAFMYFLDPTIPRNYGCFRPIEVQAPLGSIFNPRFPAPVSGSTLEAGGRVREMVLGALSSAAPRRALAGWTHSMVATIFAGTHPETGKRFISFPLDALAVGGGAKNHCDGWHASHPSASNMLTQNVEVMEQYYPMRYMQRALTPDGGGAGRFRGGPGMTSEWELLSDVVVMGTSSRRVYPPRGIFGGKEGIASTIEVVQDGVRRQMPQKFAGLKLKAGDRILTRTPGGGGFGDPAERDRSLAEQDVKEGYVSVEGLERDYGIKLERSAEVDALGATPASFSKEPGGTGPGELDAPKLADRTAVT